MVYLRYKKVNLTSIYHSSAKANLRADSWSVLQPYLPVVWYQLTHVGSDIFNLKAAVFCRKSLSSFTLSGLRSSALINFSFTEQLQEVEKDISVKLGEVCEKSRHGVNIWRSRCLSHCARVQGDSCAVYLKGVSGPFIGLAVLTMCALLSTIQPCCALLEWERCYFPLSIH